MTVRNSRGGGGGSSLGGSGGGSAGIGLESIALADLSDVTAKTGTGTEVAGITSASLASDDYLSWDGAKWVNTVPAITFRVDDTGVSFALVTGDKLKLVTAGNATSNTVTIAAAGTAGFPAGWFTTFCTTGAGNSTITPTTSTINGAASLVLGQNDCASIHSDGANYRARVYRSVPVKTTGTTNFLREDYTFAAGASFDPLDTATAYYRDEFAVGTNSSSAIGQLRWTTGSIGSAPAVSAIAAAAPNFGVMQFATNASPTAGQGGAMYTHGNGTGLFNYGGNTNWTITYIFQPSSTTDILFRLGAGAGFTTQIPTNGIYIRFDTSLGTPDTNFMLCVSNTGTETCVSTAQAPTVAFYRSKVFSVVSGTIRAQMYNASGAAVGSEVCLNSGGTGGCTAATIPTAVMLPWMTVGAGSTVQRNVQVDLFATSFTSLSR